MFLKLLGSAAAEGSQLQKMAGQPSAAALPNSFKNIFHMPPGIARRRLSSRTRNVYSLP